MTDIVQALRDTLPIQEVVVEERIRKEFGDLKELANSIREVGLIQPIVLTREHKLVAGERRLRALKELGVTALIHAKTFIYNDEVDELKLKAAEIEENVKRKNLSWQEEILAKKKLLDILQSIHGVASSSRPTREESLGITSAGFGINKLASLLGESNAATSRDIQLATLIEAVPMLAKAETKEAARRTASLATVVAAAIQQQAVQASAQPVGIKEERWKLYDGRFEDNASNVDSSSIDFVLVDPPYGEDVQGMGPQSNTLLAQPFRDDKGSMESLYEALAKQSYRVLREDRFAVFFFGFSFYFDLLNSLLNAGFNVDPTPLIWVKPNVINTSPYTRYGRSYEPILVARKGEPKLLRPSQRDVITIDNTSLGGSDAKVYHAQKPIALLSKLILDLCVPGGTIVDWCAGSGSTGVAALQLQRKVYLFEKDTVACQIIRSRMGGLLKHCGISPV